MKKRLLRIINKCLPVSFFIAFLHFLLGITGALSSYFTVDDGFKARNINIPKLLKDFLSGLAYYSKYILIIAVVLLIVAFLIWRYVRTEMEDRQTRNLSWFDAQRRNTEYSGGEEYLYELKRFFKQKDVEFSWWAVTGVAGIGKTRLVLETLRDEELQNADVQWLSRPDDYGEKALKERVDVILEKTNLRNIIIAEDAQIYMDNIGMLIEHILGKQISGLGRHKIRLLLLIRMGEDEDLRDRYKQLASKTRQSGLQQKRFSEFAEELRVEKYDEKDIAQIVKTYVVNTKRNRKRENALTSEQISEMQTKTIQVLTTDKMDPKHLRPLFAMFIADALLAGKDPMSWDIQSVLDYAVLAREDEFIKMEVNDLQKTENRFVFEKVRGIICLSIIRSGMTMSELGGIKEDLEEELKLSGTGLGIKDFLKEMQLLGKDGVIRIFMPDILSEYYVLRILVLNTDEDDFHWVMERLYSSLEGVEEFRKKVRQDFRYLYDEEKEGLKKFYKDFFAHTSCVMSLDIIRKLLSEYDLRDSNAVILHEAVEKLVNDKSFLLEVAVELHNTIYDAPELEEKIVCISELRSIAEKNNSNDAIVLECCKSLVNMIVFTLNDEEREEYFSELRVYAKDSDKLVDVYVYGVLAMLNATNDNGENKKYISELESLYNNNTEVKDCVKAYSKGLGNIVGYVSTEEEKLRYYSILEQLVEKYKGNVDLSVSYSTGLYNMIYGSSKVVEKRRYLKKLEHLARDNNPDVRYQFSCGLINMITYDPQISLKRQYYFKLKKVINEDNDNTELIRLYCMGLSNMIINDNDVGEKRQYWGILYDLAIDYADDPSIVFYYIKGVFDIRYDDIENYGYYMSELNRLLSIPKYAQIVKEKAPDIIVDTREELLGY